MSVPSLSAPGAANAPTAMNDARLRGRWLFIVRMVWLLIAMCLLVNFVLGIQAYYGQLRTVCTRASADCGAFWLPTPANVQALQTLGLSVEVYAAGTLACVVIVSLVFLGVGAIIFWRKSDQWFGLLVSLLLVMFGCFGFIDQLQVTNFPTLTLPLPFQAFINFLSFAQYPALAIFLLTFPTGRFAPRWSWGVVPLWVVETIVFDLPAPYGFTNWPGWLEGTDILVVYGSIALVQVYRYRRIYTQAQRQQTKWVVFGFATGLLVVVLASIIGAVAPGLSMPDSPYQLLNGVFVGILFLSVPFSVVVAILRYRLWDIDAIINKALVYGLLTALLAVVYAGLIIGLESLAGVVSGGKALEQPIRLVVSTLAVAGLFLPVRRRIQTLIDRRFYRRKYDAEKTLAAFSATLRNEVDLNQVREQLLAVVNETMQPTHISLWLRQPERLSKQQASEGPIKTGEGARR